MANQHMTNFELMQKILHTKSKEEIVLLLKKNRIPVNKSKYC